MNRAIKTMTEFGSGMKEMAKAVLKFEQQLRVVSLYMPATAPWPFGVWWGPKMHPLAASLTMEFAAIEMAAEGVEIRWWPPKGTEGFHALP